MKTALQEAIADIKEHRDSGNADVDTCNAILLKLASMLHKEKEQIMDAHTIGLILPLEMEATKQAEDYYNETFNTKEK